MEYRRQKIALFHFTIAIIEPCKWIHLGISSLMIFFLFLCLSLSIHFVCVCLSYSFCYFHCDCKKQKTHTLSKSFYFTRCLGIFLHITMIYIYNVNCTSIINTAFTNESSKQIEIEKEQTREERERSE